MQIGTLTPDRYADAVALWEATGLTRPWNDPLADIERAMAGPSSTVLAGVVDGRLVATAMTGHDGHRGWVYYLAVDASHQRQGLGRTMMDAVEEWLAGWGVVKCQLMLRTDNLPAAAFYERIGYDLSAVKVFAKWLAQ